MPFDTNIYGRLDLSTPMRLGALLDPANIERQRAEQMATQEKITQIQDQRTLRDLLAGSPDINTAAQRLSQAGRWQDASKLQGIISAQQQAQAKAEEAKRKQALEQAVFAASMNPTDDAFRAVLSASGVDPAMHDQAIAQLPSDPAQRAAMISLPPAKRAELEFQLRKQEEAKAADLARAESTAKAAEQRQAALFAQQNALQAQRDAAAERRLQATLSSKGVQGAKAPSGYRYTESGDLEPIPGGPADTKRIAAEEKAKSNAQKATDFADMGLGVIDQLMNSKGLKDITGWASMVPIIPNTEQAKADALAKQLEGQAFLQAFQSLKGGGAITETEGKKATQAIARLQRNQKEKDYRSALTELKGILENAKNRASGTPSGKAKAQPYKSKSGAIIEIEE